MSQYSVLGGALEGNFTVLIEYSANNPLYIGKARPGTSTSESLWQVQRLTYTSNNMTAREWAEADAGFIHAWTGRAGFSYS